MKLYRCTETEPKVMTPALKTELDALIEDTERIKELAFPKVIKQLGPEKIRRKFELGQLTKNFFTDDINIAKSFAGPEGFLTVIQVPDDVAQSHYGGMEVVGENKVSTNFVFSGEELYQLQLEGKYQVESLAGEKTDETKTAGVKQDINRTVYGSEMLPEHDQQALSKFRGR